MPPEKTTAATVVDDAAVLLLNDYVPGRVVLNDGAPPDVVVCKIAPAAPEAEVTRIEVAALP